MQIKFSDLKAIKIEIRNKRENKKFLFVNSRKF